MKVVTLEKMKTSASNSSFGKHSKQAISRNGKVTPKY
jgi:hypothetical protein